jgi:3'-phosphoadenosine 5'-phosphosulfate sulfotransferase (PAPS reductase)/FAD synthetase
MNERKYSIKEALARTDARHVLGLSGGKDSAALAVYIKDRYPELHARMEYFFSDTGAELQEVYDFLEKLEAYLGKEIVRLSSGRPFEHWLKVHNDFLPSPRQRWCTRVMKIEPFERWIGDNQAISYIGIRADEFREGYISHKENIKAVFPFIEDGLVRDEIFQILDESVGIPKYYRWRSRSGCYFCFFQRQDEWLGLKENHPTLFEMAAAIEREAGNGYTWVQGRTLQEVADHAKRKRDNSDPTRRQPGLRWQDAVRFNTDDEDPEDQACLICTL